VSRYSTFKYAEDKYGASSLTTLLWGLEVDWDDDDVFDGTNEAPRMINMQTERGSDYLISSDGKGFDPVGIGAVIITLDNYDGKFDPYNTSSPLYGYLEPGKKVRITVKNGSAGSKYSVFTGILQNVEPLGRRETVDLIIEDGWRKLAEDDATTELYQNKTADEAIGYILDAVSWPSIWGSALDTAPDSIPYWWATGKRAKSEIEDVVNSGLGNVFVAADGTFTYYSRQRTDDAVMVLTEDLLLKDVAMPQPWEFKRNLIKVQTHPRTAQSLQVIWTLQETPAIDDNDNFEIWTPYRYEGEEVPAIDVATPVATTDYTANTNEAGTGTNKTSDIAVTIYKFSNTSKIIYKNNSGGTVYLTLAQLRGKPINAPDVGGIVVEGTGYDKYPRVLDIDLPWQQNYYTGLDLANYLESFLNSNQPFPTIYVRGRPTIQFGLELYDKVGLKLDTWGIDLNFRIGKIKHRFMSPTGQDVLTEFKLFPVYVPVVSDYWDLGVDELGVGTYLGV